MSRLALRGPEAERGSMPLLLLVSLVGMLLGALLVPMVINQDRTTRYATSRVHGLDAAQAGIDVAVGRIRAALGSGASSDGTPIGLSSRLPCAPKESPVAGPVSGGGNGRYSVVITYYTADPVLYPATGPMLCDSSAGTYDSASGRTTPSYAKLESTGTDGPAVNGVTQGRTVVSYYVFRTSDVNVAGGVIRIYPDPSTPTPYCMDAGSATPAVGTPLALAQCSTTFPPVPKQVFAYRQDLTIQLLSSVTSSNPNGMCLDSAAPLTNSKPVTLQKCAVLGSPIWHQQWSFNDSGHFEGSLGTSATTSPDNSPNKDNLANICINAAAQNAGQAITVATCTGGIDAPTQAWIPAPTVGAGQASGFRLQPPFTNYQLVNYGEFGRCMDITGQQPAKKYLIDYPCKQNPYPGAVTFNQIFSTVVRPDGKYWIRTFDTNDNNNAYCLTSTPAAGGYTYFDPCDPAQTLQEFTPDPMTYNIRDYNGLCIGLTSPKGTDQWSALANGQCTGAATQKWDANPSISVPTLQNTYERPASQSSDGP